MQKLAYDQLKGMADAVRETLDQEATHEMEQMAYEWRHRDK